ncbi:AbiJ-NTD4 domain-containing protein [Acinetobacter zhairhuonensis]|uniref:AbiJ-NTD4 domain-containing protein n=1 Tax=Acinetobacter sp. A7.4 TaxID=2919921 RepID=UPI001F4DB41F|nr:hypothetical protein [Acinetobacter sp. A7.4]MCJ8160829.1 hypothetical protein [Acinetobacter sp. A7.4]
MRFSERYGYKPVREIIQKESINNELKNRLWNIISISIFEKYQPPSRALRVQVIKGSNLDFFFSALFHSFFKKRVDQIPLSIQSTIEHIDKLFFGKYKWFEIYDLIETCIEYFPFQNEKDSFILLLNDCLQSENSAYRVINQQITEITSEQEIQSIEDALENTDQYSGVQQHLNQALKLMSDRQNPDYRNSIKESISGVEALAMQLLEDNSITLGKAIPKLRSKYNLHPTLMESLNKLYGYSSDEDGVRHGSPNSSTVTYIDAKFMLVACTNFINYLIEKTKGQN